MSSRPRSVVRSCRPIAAAVTALGLAAGLAAAAPAASAAPIEPADDLASRFTLAVLPDTQF